MSDWRETLCRYIEREAKPVDKYGHQPRLYALTRRIGRGLEYDDDVVYAAVWLHDLGVFQGHRPEDSEALSRWDNVRYAMERTPELLREFGFPDAKIPAVLDAIRTHQAVFETTSVEAAILRDADILEQLGSVGILRTVAKVGRDARFRTFTEAVASLRRGLDSLPSQLRLVSAKHLAQDRVKMLRAFLEGVEREAGKNLF